MNVGDKVRVSAAYGKRHPAHTDYVGRTGTLVTPPTPLTGDWIVYVPALIEGDNTWGLFAADELEPA